MRLGYWLRRRNRGVPPAPGAFELPSGSHGPHRDDGGNRRGVGVRCLRQCSPEWTSRRGGADHLTRPSRYAERSSPTHGWLPRAASLVAIQSDPDSREWWPRGTLLARSHTVSSLPRSNHRGLPRPASLFPLPSSRFPSLALPSVNSFLVNSSLVPAVAIPSSPR